VPRLAAGISGLAALLAVALACAPALGAPPRTQLLSRAFDGGLPNGPSRNGAISQDRQLARYAAFESDASNIVRGDGNGTTDVFLVRRERPYDRDGPPWSAARVSLLSRGLGGEPANGPSYRPDLDGEQLHAPRCVAFLSRASNLVPGDTNGKMDAFVRYLRSGRIVRVSVTSAGEEANGDTFEVKVDGHCERVAFVSDASNLALTATDNRTWRSAVTQPPLPLTKQVYVRILSSLRDNEKLSGLTFLASASEAGEPGNADSGEIAFARGAGGCGRQGRCGDFSGEDVFFATRSDNLISGDTNLVSDVYRRTFGRRFVRLRFPRPTRIDGERVRSTIVGVGGLRMRTSLVSTTPSGGPANGPSGEPSTNDPGRYVAFRTEASNILDGDSNGVADIARVDTSEPGSFAWISRVGRSGPIANGPSADPSIGRAGTDVQYETDATNLEQHDKNCAKDVFQHWTAGNRNVFMSFDSANRIPNAPYGTRDPCPPVVADGAENPAVSYYVNYSLFETAYPLMDLPLARRELPGLDRDLRRAAELSRTSPELHQVYLRYVGPR